MLRDGRWQAAAELKPGASLMPLYRQMARGYEMVYQPLNGHLHPTHRLADEWNLRHGLYADAAHTHRHHVDHDRLNNNPWNIVRMPASEHIALHNAENYGESFDPEEHGAAIREALLRRMSDPEWAKRYGDLQRDRAERFWHEDEYLATREALLEQRRNPNEATRQAHREAMIARYRAQAERDRQSERMRAVWATAGDERRLAQAEQAHTLRLRGEITSQVVRDALHRTGSIRAAARMLECDRSTSRRFPEELAAFRGQPAPRNHKVAAVRSLGGEHDVYCLTVPEAGNFALEDGVFTHNCGIIVNVTPLEPEWEGHVTLEFSNTTPLPAKIYANEGVAQMLFFESDEICETSYRDRGGKYQGQTGVTLPKI
jgi:dCTP deaminase